MRFGPPLSARTEGEKGKADGRSESRGRPQSTSDTNGRPRTNAPVPQCAKKDYRSNLRRDLLDDVKKPKSKALKVNLLNCKYDVVKGVSSELHFEEVEEEGDQWDLYWTDLSVSMERVARLKPFQCINHFPGMMEICRKATLARNLKKMRQMFPKDFTFFPEVSKHAT
eukprot:1178973-Prorocentrum_minimum.AAC.4